MGGNFGRRSTSIYGSIGALTLERGTNERREADEATTKKETKN